MKEVKFSSWQDPTSWDVTADHGDAVILTFASNADAKKGEQIFNELLRRAERAESARPEVDAIANDAARYRWFRENWGVENDGPDTMKLYTLINARFRRGLSEKVGFDAAIDGAISSSPMNKEGS